jgi:hypothetical protein
MWIVWMVFLRCVLGRVGFEIAQQSLKRFHIRIMVFPAFKVPNVTCPLDVCGPAGGTLDNSGVQTDRKENGSFGDLFFGKGSFDLELNPIAG